MYCEKLSEQLTIADYQTNPSTTSSSNTTATSTAIDGANYNRLIAYGLFLQSGVTATAAYTMSVQWQASVAATFGGTPTTITTCTEAVTGVTTTTTEDVLSCEISGEQVQSAREAEDRYVRANVIGTTDHKKISVSHLILADAKRYHPN